MILRWVNISSATPTGTILVLCQAMLSKVPGKDVTVHIIAARVRMDMKVRVRFFPVGSVPGSSFQMKHKMKRKNVWSRVG